MVRYLVLLFGVLTCSTAVILIKASHTHPCVLAGLRLLLAAALLAPLFFSDWRKHHGSFTRSHLRRTILPAFLLAVHFISWNYGARMIIAAQASLIVNLVPVAMPFLLHWLMREQINRTEVIGTVIAMSGVLVLSARDALNGGGDARGTLVCFGSMLLFATYLALGRKNRDFPSIWLYVVPVYLVAGLICLFLAIPWLSDFEVRSPREWLLMLGLALLPTILGHSILNASLRHIRGQVVSLFNVAQFVFAGVMAYALFHEAPQPAFYLASALVVAGVAAIVLSAPPQPRLR